MPLLMHGEVTDPAVDVFDREATFIERVLSPLAQTQPDLRIVMEHITTSGFVPRTRTPYPVPHMSYVVIMCLAWNGRDTYQRYKAESLCKWAGLGLQLWLMLFGALPIV